MNGLKKLRREWLVRLKDRELYCVLCGCLIESKKDMNMDHWIPASKGGPTDENNCAPVHKWCNTSKADHMPEHWQEHGYTLLANLIHAWTLHQVKFPILKAYKSLEALK